MRLVSHPHPKLMLVMRGNLGLMQDQGQQAPQKRFLGCGWTSSPGKPQISEAAGKAFWMARRRDF
jgi:hypothetical protein